MLYVEDILSTSSSTPFIAWIKFSLHEKFAMTDLGLLQFFLGLQITQLDLGVTIAQSKYAQYLFIKFKMKYCKLAPFPFIYRI